MKRRFEVSGVDALRLFRGLPKSRASRLSLWIARGPSGLYSTTTPVDHGVRVMDTTRLRVLETLLPHCESLSAYADDAQQASAWVLDFGFARLTLALTAEPWRGFSGEGQALSAMMFDAEVKSGDVTHHVREVNQELRCTCAWFAKHQGDRGPCKHVLAASTLRPAIE